jgi:exosortase/archaeosortase family protein
MRPSEIYSFFKNRLNVFYLLAFSPLLLVLYSAYILRGDFVTWIILFYALALLFLKKDILSGFSKAKNLSCILGLNLVFVSFFVYYVVVRFYPPAQFYGSVNYTLCLLGLFFVFFELRAMREAFAPILLIVGATAIPFFGQSLEVYLKPAIPSFVQMMTFVLKILNIPVELIDPVTFQVQPPHSSPVLVSIAPACISIYSVSTFSILIIVTLLELHSSLREILFWSVVGAIGTFLVNIIRVSFILVVIYYFGYENWPTIHNPLGYVLFFAWLGLFFLIFSKRENLKNSANLLRRKIH